ncbi:hypothetical protein KW568_17775 [Pseudomonas sp. HD6515]|uniref:hypothetical protein n=1 Tax=Pseudomonas sp. HD6515 TaxID=2856556 RepID=UPI00217D5F0B|nr:hypothetical protein [Pseudomonas sp. HD6515]UWH20884.1 hypothetical protein KW568_17775 [Pseudomonas sp. HD6515]
MSMCDQQLLELAAKAAGIRPVLCYEAARNCLRIGSRDSYRLWRPLQDDSDALKLLVDLNFEVERNGGGERFYVGPFGEAKWMEDADDHWFEGADEHEVRSKALRTAIVRAAAEIGQAMQECK